MTAALASAVQLPPEDPNDSSEGRMSFLEHLEELRKRLIRSLIAVAVGMAVAFLFIDRIVLFILDPMRQALPAGATLIYTRPAEAFSLYVNVALIAGTLLAAPFIMFQAWRFIAPGLYAKERRFVVPFVSLTTIGALGGATFGHYIVFPYMLAFFGTFSSPDLAFLPRLEDAFGLYVRMLIGLVLVFQTPTVIFFLAKLGVVTAGFLWSHFKYAVLGSFVLAALLTPSPDPWNQALFAGPMIALYLVSIGIAWLVRPAREDAVPGHTTSGGGSAALAVVVLEQFRKNGYKAQQRSRR